jgi:hypothetical protein
MARNFDRDGRTLLTLTSAKGLFLLLKETLSYTRHAQALKSLVVDVQKCSGSQFSFKEISIRFKNKTTHSRN